MSSSVPVRCGALDLRSTFFFFFVHPSIKTLPNSKSAGVTGEWSVGPLQQLFVLCPCKSLSPPSRLHITLNDAVFSPHVGVRSCLPSLRR